MPTYSAETRTRPRSRVGKAPLTFSGKLHGRRLWSGGGNRFCVIIMRYSRRSRYSGPTERRLKNERYRRIQAYNARRTRPGGRTR